MIRALALAVLAASPAAGQQPCAPFVGVVERLASVYGEAPVMSGQAGSAILFLFANSETGTWTVVIYHPDGRGCMAASGAGYEAISLPVPGDPA